MIPVMMVKARNKTFSFPDIFEMKVLMVDLIGIAGIKFSVKTTFKELVRSITLNIGHSNRFIASFSPANGALDGICCNNRERG